MMRSKEKRQSGQPNGKRLSQVYTSVAEGCVECGLCQKDCHFLQKYGLPKYIAEQGLKSHELLRESFECSMCTLCTAICPKDIDPAAMFALLRRKAQAEGQGHFREHRSLLRFEQWGLSPLFSWYGLPKGCDTVFFPGCALSGSRSERVVQVYGHLRQQIPALGIVVDCCTKPSHDLGRADFFTSVFGALKKKLEDNGITKILVACPSCYRIWKDYGEPVAVQTIYEKLAEALSAFPGKTDRAKTVTVHDPCTTRNDGLIHAAVRKLVTGAGLTVREMKHHGCKTVCCGEGGAACYLAPGFAGNWTAVRARETEGEHIITYCAGCTNFLGRKTSADHVIDLFFAPERTLSGKSRVAGSPFTWYKRLLLIRKLKKLVKPAISGQRGRGYRF